MPTKFDPENPPVDFATARFVIGETREERYANARKVLDTARGRPRKGTEPGGSSGRTLRLPDATWRDVEAAAAARGMTVHRFLRVIIAERLYTRTLHENVLAAKQARGRKLAKPRAKVAKARKHKAA